MPENQAAFPERLTPFAVARPRRFSPNFLSGPYEHRGSFNRITFTSALARASE